MRGLPGLLIFCGVMVGCRSAGYQPPTPPPLQGQPIGLQIQRLEPTLQGCPFRVLLDFESPDDLAFVAGDTLAQLDTHVAHTGTSSLRLEAGQRGFQIRLGDLLGDLPFPGPWLMVGAYFYCENAATITVVYPADNPAAEGGGTRTLRRSVPLIPRHWTPVMLDLSPLRNPNAPSVAAPGTLFFQIAAPDSPVWCDDVIVCDNSRQWVDSPTAGQGFSVCLHGLTTTIDRPGYFRFDIDTPDAGTDGWVLREASLLRVVFNSRQGQRWWTIYSDGRQYKDGQFIPPPADDPDAVLLAMEHQFIARIEVPEELGRVDRNHPADKNNDGYAEMLGSYELLASGRLAMFDVTIIPQSPALARPVLEVARLPEGRVVVSIEGQLLRNVVRLSDGRVLVELPGIIRRAVTVHFHVE